jgi:hypothetical protein
MRHDSNDWHERLGPGRPGALDDLEQIGLEGNLVDHADDLADLMRRLIVCKRI